MRPTTRAPRSRYTRRGELLDAGDCPALTRLGWAIQSSWTNGVRCIGDSYRRYGRCSLEAHSPEKLTRPICGTYGKHFAKAWLRVFSAPKQSPRPPQRHAPRPRREHAGLTQTVGRFIYHPKICYRQTHDYNGQIKELPTAKDIGHLDDHNCYRRLSYILE